MIQPMMAVLLNVFLWCSVVLIFGCSSEPKLDAQGNAKVDTTIHLTPNELRSVAEESFIYGYPLVLMEVTKDQQTNVSKAGEETAPVNQFAHMTTYPDAGFNAVVRPNFDTLYSAAWLDLSKEPMVLSIPDTGKRYFLMPLLSAWSDVFASPGTRTTGNKKENYIVTGPQWQGSIPQGLVQIKAPTNDVWVIGRTRAEGKNDLGNVQALQKQYRLTPLSQWGRSYTPPTNVAVKPGVDRETAPMDQVESMPGVIFFQRMAESLKNNPPSAKDTEMVSKLAQMGIVPGMGFDVTKLTRDQVTAINEGARRGLERIVDSGRQSQANKINGWVFMKPIGTYGTDYSLRAHVAKIGLGANLAEDAVYPWTSEDQSGRPLMGGQRYVMKFTKAQLPPVKGFWSLTVYDNRGFAIKNPINRFAISNSDKLKYNKDGSLDIYIQNARPAPAQVSNWLPAPTGSFVVQMRLYWPQESILKNQWRPPGIQRVELPNQLSQTDSELK